MLRGILVALAVGLMAALVPGAVAAELAKPVLNGAFKLRGTHGYRVSGIFGSDGKRGEVVFFVDKAGEEATYAARGAGTANGVDVDLGALGKFDVEARPTGGSETLHEGCGGRGKAITIPASELVGTIELHGEEGFTEAAATQTPLLVEPLLNLVCAGSMTTGGSSARGVLLKAMTPGSPSLLLVQNHPGAKVSYRAKMHEKEGNVVISRTVAGHLGAGSLRHAPSLASATFSAGSPFTGSAIYSERTPPSELHPGRGTWRGSLKVDFPGHADVPLAGRGFEASITHAERTESSE